MEIFVYRHGAPNIEEGFTIAELPALLKDEQAIVWVNMNQPTKVDEDVLLDVFQFHPLTVEDCRENRHYPKVEEFPSYLYLIVHGVRADTSPDHFNTIELDAFLGPNYVITYHHDEFRSIENVKQLIRTSPIACQRGAAFLLHQILDQIVDYYSPVLDDFDERIDQLEADIFTLKTPNNSILEEIMDLKRGVLRLRRISAKQREVMLRMSRGEFQLIDAQMLPFYRDVHDHIVRVTDLAESYRDLISGTLEAYLSVVSNRMNEIMKVLTIFSAIMLPLTFIAGVYGMNFDNMPELHSRYGYYTVWIIMSVVAVGMLGLFWKRGWIGSGPKKRIKDEG
uniref:Magnesium transport protein CorA n=1 Tax=uncultured Acidobacteriota bacterium TaxID=171953 RepID=Q7X2U8_9BACT|nr:putative magnesium and cobalt transport protein [uncultured Acidobacteriota bacterium]